MSLRNRSRRSAGVRSSVSTTRTNRTVGASTTRASRPLGVSSTRANRTVGASTTRTNRPLGVSSTRANRTVGASTTRTSRTVGASTTRTSRPGISISRTDKSLGGSNTRRVCTKSGTTLNTARSRSSVRPNRKSVNEKSNTNQVQDPCMCGPNFYQKVLGPTADETILVGLQTFMGLCEECPPNQEDVDRRESSVTIEALRSEVKFDENDEDDEDEIEEDVEDLENMVEIGNEEVTEDDPVIEEEEIREEEPLDEEDVEILEEANGGEEEINEYERLEQFENNGEDKMSQKPSSSDSQSEGSQTEPQEVKSYNSQTEGMRENGGSQTDYFTENNYAQTKRSCVKVMSTQSKYSKSRSMQNFRQSIRNPSQPKLCLYPPPNDGIRSCRCPHYPTITKSVQNTKTRCSSTRDFRGSCCCCVGTESDETQIVTCCSCQSCPSKSQSTPIKSCIRVSTPFSCSPNQTSVSSKRCQKQVRVCCDCCTCTSSSGLEDTDTDLATPPSQMGDVNGVTVRYAITKISKFFSYTTFEVMKSTSKIPKVMPKTLEGVFVLKNCPSKE